MCLYPKLIKNRKYTENIKNGGNIPPITDDRVKYVAIGCQNCMECRKQKAREWQARLLEDIKTNTNGKFITLTFNNEALKKLTDEIITNSYNNNTTKPEAYDMDNAIATLATRRFLERFRKSHQHSLRHWLITELGHQGTERIHLHGIIWTNEPLSKIEHIWQYGWMWKGKTDNGKITNYVNAQTINYIIKYVTKADQQHPNYKSKILTTPGIGANFTNKPKGDWQKKNTMEQKQTKHTKPEQDIKRLYLYTGATKYIQKNNENNYGYKN